MSVALRPELWLAVIALGAYHGLSPGMGWPLAVANGMWAKEDRAVFATLLPLACGHFLAMAAALLPLSLLLAYVDWSQPVRVAAGGMVAAFGIYKLVNRRHPRVLARLGPNRLILWSFLVATSVAVSAVHTLAMAFVGGIMAWIVYRWAGLALLRRTWLNLESVWAGSLVVAGVAACVAGGLG